MKKLITIAILITLFISCKKEEKKDIIEVQYSYRYCSATIADSRGYVYESVDQWDSKNSTTLKYEVPKSEHFIFNISVTKANSTASQMECNIYLNNKLIYNDYNYGIYYFLELNK